MSLVLVISTLLRLLSLVWAGVFLLRRRDHRLLLLAVMIALMAARQALAVVADAMVAGHWSLVVTGRPADITELLVSVILFGMAVSWDSLTSSSSPAVRSAESPAQQSARRRLAIIALITGSGAVLLSLLTAWVALTTSSQAIREALRAVPVPPDVVNEIIRAVAQPCGIAVAVIAGLLVPLTIGLIHHFYRTAEADTARAWATSESRYRTLVDLLPHGVQRNDLAGRITLSNPAHHRMHGYETGELIGKYIWHFKSNDAEREGLRRFFHHLVTEQPDPTPYFTQDRTKDGRLIDVQVDWTYERDDAGNLVGFISVISDITRRVQMEASLRASETRFRMVCVFAPVGILLSRPDGQCVYVNDRCTQITGLSFEQCMGFGWTQNLHPDDSERVLTEWKRAVETVSEFASEFRFRTSDGTTTWVQGRARIHHDQQGRVEGYIGTLVDLTQRKQAEETVRQMADRLRVLSRQLLEAQETERRRIARDLHDQIGQSLTAARMSLQTLERSAGRGITAEAWTACRNMLDETIQQVRDLSLALRPSILDDLGLEAALHWLFARHGQASSPRISFETNLGEQRFASEIETASFRIVQEALTNVVRHAKAERVTVRVWKTETRLELSIKDDGVGFDVPNALDTAGKGASLGLLGIQERASLVEGDVQFESVPYRGTRVCIHIPIE